MGVEGMNIVTIDSRKRLLCRILAMGIVLVASTAALAEPPWGWGLSTNAPKRYVASVDRVVHRSGRASGSLESLGAVSARDFGVLLQKCDAEGYRRKRVRMTGYLRTEDVRGWAGMWMRVDPRKGPSLAFDNMQDRPVTGTTPWVPCEITLNVPQEGDILSFGILLVGAGKAWLDDVRFEVLGTAALVTKGRRSRDVCPEPLNLDFEPKGP